MATSAPQTGRRLTVVRQANEVGLDRVPVPLDRRPVVPLPVQAPRDRNRPPAISRMSRSDSHEGSPRAPRAEDPQPPAAPRPESSAPGPPPRPRAAAAGCPAIPARGAVAIEGDPLGTGPRDRHRCGAGRTGGCPRGTGVRGPGRRRPLGAGVGAWPAGGPRPARRAGAGLRRLRTRRDSPDRRDRRRRARATGRGAGQSGDRPAGRRHGARRRGDYRCRRRADQDPGAGARCRPARIRGLPGTGQKPRRVGPT